MASRPCQAKLDAKAKEVGRDNAGSSGHGGKAWGRSGDRWRKSDEKGADGSKERSRSPWHAAGGGRRQPGEPQRYPTGQSRGAGQYRDHGGQQRYG